MNIVRVSCLPFPSCTSRRCRSTISTCARQYYSRSASLSLYHKNDVNREYERSGFTLSAGTSRGFPSRRQLTRQPAAVDALGFRRRPSEAHFIHGTTASVPSAPIPLFLPLLLALPMAPLFLYLSVLAVTLFLCLPRSRAHLSSVCLSLLGFFPRSPTSTYPSLVYFLFCPILSLPVFLPFSHSSKCHAYIASGSLVSSVFLNFGELKSKRGTKARSGVRRCKWVSMCVCV